MSVVMQERRHSYQRGVVDQILVWTSTIGVVLICATLVGMILTIVMPYDVLTKMDLQVESPVYQGGPLKLHMDYCKDIDILPKRVIVTLQNDITVVLNSGGVRLQKGCRVTHTINTLSPEIPAGTYIMEFIMVYEPWPWRTITYTFRAKAFQIHPTPEDKS